MNAKITLTVRTVQEEKEIIEQYSLTIDGLLAYLKAKGEFLDAELRIEKGEDVMVADAQVADDYAGFFIESGTQKRGMQLIAAATMPDQEDPYIHATLHAGDKEENIAALMEYVSEKPILSVDPDYFEDDEEVSLA